MTEHERMFRGIMDWMGFKKIYLEFQASARQEGSPGYSYPKLIELAVNSITSFSLWPLKITGYLGLFITSISGILLVWMLVNYFLLNLFVFSPLAIVVVANTFLIGLILVSIGLVALYVGKIHTEVANRPLFIVRERLNGANPLSESNKIN
jgi:dolichol-phosphate mannosyltransferase